MYTTIKRERSKVPGEMCYEIIGPLFYQGTMSNIHTSLGTYKLINGVYVYHQHKNRLIKIEHANNEIEYQMIINESVFMRELPWLHAKNVIPLSNTEFAIIFKYFNTPTLMNYLEQNDLTFDIALKLFSACAVALRNQVIKHKITHRDIKPSNILIDPTNFSAMIIDYGVAIRMYTDDQILCGTEGYVSPENGFKMAHDDVYDIYSLGIVFKNIISKSVIPIDLMEEVDNLIQQMLYPNFMRIKIDDVINEIKTIQSKYDSIATPIEESSTQLAININRFWAKRKNEFIDDSMASPRKRPRQF